MWPVPACPPPPFLRLIQLQALMDRGAAHDWLYDLGYTNISEIGSGGFAVVFKAGGNVVDTVGRSILLACNAASVAAVPGVPSLASSC